MPLWWSFSCNCNFTINPKNSTLFVSFGAHPILEVSLERTMTELMQGRDLNNLDSFEIPTFDMDMVSDYFNIEHIL